MSKLVSVGNEWYNIRIFGQKVNWATFVVSGVAFVTFEVIRRKMIQKQIEEQQKKIEDQQKTHDKDKAHLRRNMFLILRGQIQDENAVDVAKTFVSDEDHSGFLSFVAEQMAARSKDYDLDYDVRTKKIRIQSL